MYTIHIATYLFACTVVDIITFKYTLVNRIRLPFLSLALSKGKKTKLSVYRKNVYLPQQRPNNILISYRYIFLILLFLEKCNSVYSVYRVFQLKYTSFWFLDALQNFNQYPTPFVFTTVLSCIKCSRWRRTL